MESSQNHVYVRQTEERYTPDDNIPEYVREKFKDAGEEIDEEELSESHGWRRLSIPTFISQTHSKTQTLIGNLPLRRLQTINKKEFELG